MKRLINALILVLVLVPLMLLMRWGGEAKAPWSAPAGGVQARLVAPRFLWRADQDENVHVRIRNRSHETFRPAGPVTLHVEREGAPATDRVVPMPQPGDVVVEPRGQADIVLPPMRFDDAPGLVRITASGTAFDLPALKLRIVKARTR